MPKNQKYLAIAKLLCFYSRMSEKKNLYGLTSEFESDELARRYLTSQKFIRDPYFPNAWFNESTGVDAHLARVTEFCGGVTFLVTYWAKHIEARRGSTDLRPARDSKFIRKLELVGADYAQV